MFLLLKNSAEFLSQFNCGSSTKSQTAQYSWRRIKDSTIYNPNLMGPADAITSLPGWIALSPFDFDVRKWMLAAFVPDGDWERTKHTLRYLSLWDSKVSRDERTYIFRRLMETDKSIASHPLALYAKQILLGLADDPCLLDEVFGFIKKNADVLPVLSAVPLSKLPEKFQEYVAKFSSLDDKIICSDNIIPVRHVNNYAGTCAWMRQCHYETLVEGDQDTLGNLTLLYVDNRLIGSMKMYRNKSIAGLQTVQDSEGRHPVVTSGVYVTTSEITQQAEAAFEEQGKWAKLYLDRLPLLPIQFLVQKKRNIVTDCLLPVLKLVVF